MNQLSPTLSLLARFGSPAERVARAVERVAAGGSVIVVDDEDRENEGDLICAAATATPPQIAQMIRCGSGIVCLVLTEQDADRLALPPMVAHNTSRLGTAFTVTIEAKNGVSTGVSAADRATTIRTAVADGTTADDLARPGHVFPLRAHPQGLAGRRGHTEATIDLVSRAGLKPSGVLCEVTNPDGTMARLPELVAFAEANAMPIVTIEDLLAS